MYKNILFATDFSDESAIAEKKAAELAQLNSAELTVLYVIDFYPSVQLEGALGALPDIEEAVNKNAQAQMDKCAERIGIEVKSHIAHGVPKLVINEYAKDIDADLIVMGSHGRHGLGLLLGSTTTGVLHGAQIDVLAVRVPS